MSEWPIKDWNEANISATLAGKPGNCDGPIQGWGDPYAHSTDRDSGADGVAAPDLVNHPPHYKWLKDRIGVEVIDITELFGFNLGNALKYILRSSEKGAALEDLQKARWYLTREIDNREGK